MRKPASILAAATAVTFAIALTAPEARADDAKRWWSARELLPEAITTVVTGSVLAGVAFGTKPRTTAFIGPSFNEMDLPAILSPKYASSIGHSYAAREIVPGGVLVGLAVGGAVVALSASIAHAAVEEKSNASARGAYIHDMLGGYVDTLIFTALTTEIFKNAFGRLRPDFQARVKYYYCNEPTPALSPSQCAGVPEDRGHVDFPLANVLEDGRSSFPSGHSSLSFATAMYGALVLGGEFQWGDHASPGVGLAALAVQGTMLGTATWIAASRVADGRHNVSDVVTGSIIGVAWANIAYWRRFDTHGQPRRLRMDVIPMPGGIGVTGTF